MQIEIIGAKLLLPEPSLHVEAGNLYLQNGCIAAIGTAPAGFVAEKTIDGTGKLVMPGLINCHTHMYMSLFRNFADDLTFDEWLFKKLMPIEDKMDAEDAYWSNLLSCIEMIRTGTTTFLDMHMFKNQNVAACGEAGLRAVLSRGLVGEHGQDEGGLRRIEEALSEAEEVAGAPHAGRFTFMLAPHAIYTCGLPFLQHLAALAKEKGLGFHIHLAETQSEYDNCVAQHGCTPTQLLEKAGLLDVPTVAAHCVYLAEEDFAILKNKGVSVATNPVSNMKLGNGFAPVPRLLAQGVNVCIGSDSAASNNNLNMFKEMAALSLIHKGNEKDVLAMPAETVLHCATMAGAKALGLEKTIGSIQVGKRADLAIIDLHKPQFVPQNDLVTALVYAANGSEVCGLIVDGQPVMEDYRLLTIDETRVYSEMERIRQKWLA